MKAKKVYENFEEDMNPYKALNVGSNNFELHSDFRYIDNPNVLLDQSIPIYSKAEINKILKEAGYGFVKLSNGYYKPAKTHHSKNKGIRGPSVGPMSATGTSDHKREIENLVNDKLIRPFGVDIEINREYQNIWDSFFVVRTGKKRFTAYKAHWDDYPSNFGRDLDSGYRTYWLIFKTEDIKI